MAPTLLVLLLLLLGQAHLSMGSKAQAQAPARAQPNSNMTYHDGAVLNGEIGVSILWYGRFTPAQKAIVTDFLLSLSPPAQAQPRPKPSAAQWWAYVQKFYLSKAMKAQPEPAQVVLAEQVADEQCSLGKSLKMPHLKVLASKARPYKGGIALVLTAQDVAVEGFCSGRCGGHESDAQAGWAYVWVGNSAAQCPGRCAWPFYKPAYGPQTPPLGAPNGDVGLDGMVINIAGMVAGAVTNPFGDGFYQGDRRAPLEAATACAGVYGSGAYPGYAGKLRVDPVKGGSYNAIGARGRKFVLPALFNPASSKCITLV